jgi:AraC family transcriptional regulator
MDARPQTCKASESCTSTFAGRQYNVPQAQLPHSVIIETLAFMDQRQQDVPRSVPGTFGTSQIVLCRDGLTVSTVTLNAGLQFRSHAHVHDQLCVVLEGCYEENCDARAYTLHAGSVLWRRAGKVHANVIGADDVEVILVDIEPERSQKLCLYLAGPAAYFVPGTFDEIRRELVSELHRSDQASRIAIEGLICLLAARTGRRCTLPKSAIPEWLSNAVELIHSEYSCRIGLAQVAAAAGVHPVTVAVAFRRHFGKSVGDYIADLRTAHARQELENTHRPIAEIAQEAGFYDESHMGRVFRRRFGISPGALRFRSI